MSRRSDANETLPPAEPIARQGIWSLATSIGMQALTVGIGIATARALGPAGRGELTAVLLWPTLLAGLIGMSLPETLGYFSARASDRVATVFATGLVLIALQSVLLIVSGLILLPILLADFPQAVQIGDVFLLAVACNYLTELALGMLLGRGHYRKFCFLRIMVFVTITGILSAVYFISEITLFAVVMAYIVSYVGTAILALGLLIRQGFVGFRPERKLFWEMLSYGTKLLLGTVSSQLSARSQAIMIALLLGPIQLGYFSAVTALTSAVGLVGVSLGVVTLASVARATSFEEQRLVFVRLVKASFFLSTIMAIGLAMLAPYLIVTFLGDEFAQSIGVAQLLVLASIVLSANSVIGFGLKGLNQAVIPSMGEMTGAIVMFVALLALLPVMNLLGTVAAAMLAYLATTAYLLRFVARRLSISPTELFVPKRSDFEWVWQEFGSLRTVLRQRGSPSEA